MTRFEISTFIAIATCWLGAGSALAEICMYRDADGNVTYSNVTDAPPRNAKKIRCFKEATPSSPAPAVEDRPSSDDFPKVDSNTQRERDQSRRRILERELAQEQQRLTEAKRKLEEQESVRHGNERNYQRYLERVAPFQEAVANHERNIQSLQRELGGLR